MKIIVMINREAGSKNQQKRTKLTKGARPLLLIFGIY